MSTVFEVTAEHISRLNAVQLTSLLNRLLHLEADRNNLATSGVHVPLKITISDAGEDGRIEWSRGPTRTNWAPRRITLFQVKATELSPKQCADELVDGDDQLKKKVSDCFKKKGAYVFFCGREYNKNLVEARIKRANEKAKTKLKQHFKHVLIEFYDASRIANWTNEHFGAIVYVLEQCGQSLIAGLQSWQQWSGRDDYKRYAFAADENLKAILEQLRLFFLGHSVKKVARLVGLSGFGKTRLALEAFRPPPDPSVDPAGTALSQRLVYVRAPNSSIVSQVIDWRNQNVDGLLVVDDCEHSIHAQLAQEVKHSASRLSLLSLDFVADEKPDGTDPIIVLKESRPEVIRGILTQSYSGLADTDLDRIVEFAQGFPQMAVLLAEARLQDLPDMGRLNDNDLVRRLLWGHGQSNESELMVAEACALFDVLRVSGALTDQAKFVAKEFCDDSFRTFYRRVADLEDRGIIERRGDLIRVRPKPLAVRLAADWWRKCPPDEAKRLFHLEMPQGLIESLCARMAMLDFLLEARQLAADLCGDTGPFGQAEVLNSERGSRCFCSLVEVSPAAALSALVRVFGSLSLEELLKVGPGRRNLVWSLEKLCCRQETFEGAARLLLAFAGAENERWANNATGSFLQLFNLYLSGTEVPAIDRIAISEEAIASDNVETRLLGVKALGRALDYGPFSRFRGIEFQGSGAPIKDWKPKNDTEITPYWDRAESILIELASSTSDLAKPAAEQLVSHIRGHIAMGRIERVESWVEVAVSPHESLWSKALDQLQQASQYDAPKMSSTVTTKIQELVEKLQPTDLASRLQLLVGLPPFEHVQQKDGTFRYLDREKAEAFAEECSQRIGDLLPLVGLLISGEQRQAFPFGARLGELLESPEELIDAAIAALRETPDAQANPGFLAGILNKVQVKNPKLVQSVLTDFANDSRLAKYTARLTQAIRASAVDLDRLLDSVKKGRLDTREMASLAYGRALAHLTSEQLMPFLSELTAYSLEGANAAFEIAFFYVFPKKLVESDFRVLVREILLQPKIIGNLLSSGTHHIENVLEVARQLVADSSENALATKLIDDVITACEESNAPYSLMPSLKSFVATLLKSHPQTAWQRVEQSVIEADPLKRFRLQHLFGRGFEPDEPRLASKMPIEFLRSWCKAYPNVAPQFLAGVLPPLEKVGVEIDWSPAMFMILQDFGDREGVLGELAANMGTFSSVGSSAGYYQSFLRPLEKLLSHRSKRVSKWASRQLDWHQKMITEEKKREEERDFGIFR